jgi:hypothetical protein
MSLQNVGSYKVTRRNIPEDGIPYTKEKFVFCFNVLFVYLFVYVTCILLTLPPGGQPICSTMMIIIKTTGKQKV